METLTGNTSLTYGGTSAATTLLGGTILDTYSSGITTSNSFSLSNSTPQNTIMQNKVAVFHVVRDEDDKIIKTWFIKELWIETKNNQSVDFQVARDKDLAEYDTNDLVIKVISTISF
jgi:hypothetical protein